MTQVIPTLKQLKFLSKLIRYNYSIVYKHGNDNIITNALSYKHEDNGLLFGRLAPCFDFISLLFIEFRDLFSNLDEGKYMKLPLQIRNVLLYNEVRLNTRLHFHINYCLQLI